MKTLHKIVLLAGAVSAALTIRRELRRIRGELERADALPVLLPVADAEPTATEPLQPDDLRVAQNAPF